MDIGDQAEDAVLILVVAVVPKLKTDILQRKEADRYTSDQTEYIY